MGGTSESFYQINTLNSTFNKNFNSVPMKIKSIVAVCALMALSLVSFKPSDKEVQSEKRFGGLALYTVRDAMKDARATLGKVAQAG